MLLAQEHKTGPNPIWKYAVQKVRALLPHFITAHVRQPSLFFGVLFCYTCDSDMTNKHGQVTLQEVADSCCLNPPYHFHWQRLMEAQVIVAGERVASYNQVSRWKSVQNYTWLQQGPRKRSLLWHKRGAKFTLDLTHLNQQNYTNLNLVWLSKNSAYKSWCKF